MLNFKRIIFSILFLCQLSVRLWGQGGAASSESMDALIELDETVFEVFNHTKAVATVHRIITVFTNKGKHYGEVVIPENNFYRSKNIQAYVRNMEDKVLRELKKKDIIESNVDYSYVTASDESSKRFELTWNALPYKIEYRYELHYNSLFFWPGWFPQEDDSVLISTYTLKLHEPISYNTHAVGIEIEPQEHSHQNPTVLVWKLENIPPRIIEDFMPPENRLQMALYFAPSNFSLDKYFGSFESWEKFGRWYLQLSEGRQELSSEAKNRVRKLVDEVPTPLEKIQKLYSYLQDDTRYVALELGVGGWQPYSADWVFQNKYGDCKDLSNFMIAMLNEVGITAYPVLIRTRDRGVVFPEYPYKYFNHSIAAVPMEEDTVWLECTADYLPAGHLPPGNEGCNVLIVKPDGSKLARTPESKAEDNLWNSNVKGQIGMTGQLTIQGSIQASGNVGTDLRNALIWNKGEDQMNLLTNYLSLRVPRLGLSKYHLDNINVNYDQPVQIDFEGTVASYASQSANRLFLTPCIFNRLSSRSIPKESPEERRFPVFRKYAYASIDSLEIQLPFGYSLEAAPLPQNMETSFGQYQTDFQLEGLTLRYYRRFRIKQRLISPEQYAEYKQFMQDVLKNDQAKFVFNRM